MSALELEVGMPFFVNTKARENDAKPRVEFPDARSALNWVIDMMVSGLDIIIVGPDGIEWSFPQLVHTAKLEKLASKG